MKVQHMYKYINASRLDPYRRLARVQATFYIRGELFFSWVEFHEEEVSRFSVLREVAEHKAFLVETVTAYSDEEFKEMKEVANV